jgi:hypothetical protein
MNPNTPMRYVLAAALIADAIAVFLLYRGAVATEGDEPVLAATGLALLIAAVAVKLVRQPSVLALSLGRGIAVVMTVGLAGAGLLLFVAANFESGVHDLPEMVGLLLLALAVQGTILVAARSMDGQRLVEAMGSAINGAFKFWAVGIALVLILSLFERLVFP